MDQKLPIRFSKMVDLRFFICALSNGNPPATKTLRCASARGARKRSGRRDSGAQIPFAHKCTMPQFFRA
jgi:hypothetical protein